MSGWEQKVAEFFAAATRGAFPSIRMGPGVLRTITPLNLVGLAVILGVVFLLRSEPILAVGVVVLVILYLIYSNERAYRYAEKNPLPAVLGGTEWFQLFRDQMSAKDKTIIINPEDAPPVTGANTNLIGGSDRT